ncbi:hypothetical protein [Bartonella sp. B41]
MKKLKWYSGFRWFYYALPRIFQWKGRAMRAEYIWFSVIFRLITAPIWLPIERPELFNSKAFNSSYFLRSFGL